MNVYEKLAKARIAFMQENVKKTGNNKFAGYTYFELSDILPIVNKLAEEIKFTTVVCFEKDVATLRFIDTEKTDDFIEFSSPMSEANLKGSHPVQNLGAVETYIKRYLYQNCFEIAESDVLDTTMNPNEQKQAPAPKQQQKPTNTLPQWTKAQMEELGTILGTTVNDGEPVFTEQEKAVYRDCIKKKQAFDFVIKRVKNELQEKLAKLEQQAQQEQQKDLIEG